MPKRLKPIDVSQYTSLVESFLEDLQKDERYAESIFRNANFLINRSDRRSNLLKKK